MRITLLYCGYIFEGEVELLEFLHVVQVLHAMTTTIIMIT